VAAPLDMEFTLTEAAKPKRVAIMVSKSEHCLLDLLWRQRRGDLEMCISLRSAFRTYIYPYTGTQGFHARSRGTPT